MHGFLGGHEDLRQERRAPGGWAPRGVRPAERGGTVKEKSACWGCAAFFRRSVVFRAVRLAARGQMAGFCARATSLELFYVCATAPVL